MEKRHDFCQSRSRERSIDTVATNPDAGFDSVGCVLAKSCGALNARAVCVCMCRRHAESGRRDKAGAVQMSGGVCRWLGESGPHAPTGHPHQRLPPQPTASLHAFGQLRGTPISLSHEHAHKLFISRYIRGVCIHRTCAGAWHAGLRRDGARTLSRSEEYREQRRHQHTAGEHCV